MLAPGRGGRPPSRVLLAGDAGIGKTRLAAEFAAGARDEGAAVLYGRFDEDALAPYQPVVEMLRGWAGGASLEPLRGSVSPAAGPNSASCCPSSAPPPTTSSRSPRCGSRPTPRACWLFDAVVALLGEIGEGTPLVVASTTSTGPIRPTLQLIRHLVRAPAPHRVLFVGTYRETELPEEHPLREPPAICAARARCSAPSSAASTPARSRSSSPRWGA